MGNNLCEYDWSDLGLSIDFANFGGRYPCGPDGRIARFELIGAPAAQAGWEIDRGAEVGIDVDTLRHLYPGFREDGRELVLVETPSPIGAGGRLAVMTGFVVGAKVGLIGFMWVRRGSDLWCQDCGELCLKAQTGHSATLRDH